MLNYIKTQGRSFVQGMLAFIGFGALTWGFVVKTAEGDLHNFAGLSSVGVKWML